MTVPGGRTDHCVAFRIGRDRGDRIPVSGVLCPANRVLCSCLVIERVASLQHVAVPLLCHSSCRLDPSVILGALRNDSGSIQQRIQRAGGGATATT